MEIIGQRPGHHLFEIQRQYNLRNWRHQQIGPIPNTEGSRLRWSSVSRAYEIEVARHTSPSGVFAAGDCTTVPFTASDQRRRRFQGRAQRLDHLILPYRCHGRAEAAWPESPLLTAPSSSGLRGAATG
jgi:hypothetical protein